MLKKMHIDTGETGYPWHLFVTLFRWLTHCGLVTPYGNVDMGQHWLR